MTDEDELQEERTLTDFLADLSEDVDQAEDIREEAARWHDELAQTEPDPAAGAEEGQEPG
jgi:hypothetical protein